MPHEGEIMWYESMEAQRRFFQLLCEWWMPGCRWPDRLCEPPPFGISSIRSGERAIPVVESVVDRTPFCELRHFARAEGATAGKLGQAYGTAASIFVCAPLAGHHAVMLREMVETLLQDADVYVTDWTGRANVTALVVHEPIAGIGRLICRSDSVLKRKRHF
jgi:poly(3-hydroxybutyrate) depolymerase